MKISFLENHLPINGSVRHIIEMANDLVRRGGYEVAMSEAIIELIQNRKKADRLAKNALEHIKKYTWAASVDQLLGVLNAC